MIVKAKDIPNANRDNKKTTITMHPKLRFLFPFPPPKIAFVVSVANFEANADANLPIVSSLFYEKTSGTFFHAHSTAITFFVIDSNNRHAIPLNIVVFIKA